MGINRAPSPVCSTGTILLAIPKSNKAVHIGLLLRWSNTEEERVLALVERVISRQRSAVGPDAAQSWADRY